MSKKEYNPEYCSETVFRDWHHGQCSRKGVAEERGRLYCKQHLPSNIAAKKAAAVEKWIKKSDEFNRVHRRRANEAAFCKNLSDEYLEWLKDEGITAEEKEVKK